MFVFVYTSVMRLSPAGISDFSLRVALQTLLREYTEVNKSPKESKPFSLLQTAKARPRRKARKYLYAIGTGTLLRACRCVTRLYRLCNSPSFCFCLSGGYTRLQGGRWSDSRALSCVERFDSFSQYWTTVSSLHQARSGLGVAVLEGMIYVVGGTCVFSVVLPRINIRTHAKKNKKYFLDAPPIKYYF